MQFVIGKVVVRIPVILLLSIFSPFLVLDSFILFKLKKKENLPGKQNHSLKRQMLDIKGFDK